MTERIPEIEILDEPVPAVDPEAVDEVDLTLPGDNAGIEPGDPPELYPA